MNLSKVFSLLVKANPVFEVGAAPLRTPCFTGDGGARRVGLSPQFPTFVPYPRYIVLTNLFVLRECVEMSAPEDILYDLPDFLIRRNNFAEQGGCGKVENVPDTADPLILCRLRTGFV